MLERTNIPKPAYQTPERSNSKTHSKTIVAGRERERRNHTTWQYILWVGAGGFVGSMLRYLVSGYVQHFSGSVDFPYGTLAVNSIGCLLIGFLTELASTRGAFPPEIRALLVTGVLGGFTTFSTFSLETMNLLRDGQLMLAMMNMGASLLIGLIAVWSGFTLAYLIWR